MVEVELKKPEKRMINFEMRNIDKIELDNLCKQLGVSRTRFIKDAIADYIKKKQIEAKQSLM